MKTFTNYAAGPRGISMKDGSVVWLDPGQSEKVDAEQIAGPLPDLGSKPVPGNEDEAETLRARVAELEAQVADQGKEITRLTADLEKATAPKK